MFKDYIISPRDVCDACNGRSGPKFSLHTLRGISSAQRNNVIPTGIDLQSRLDEVRDAQIDIDSLDIEIARLQQTLDILKQRRTDLQDFKYQEMSMLAPIRRLPDDVLRKIFITCQQVLGTTPGYIHYSNPNTFVRTVTQVSNYWRSTALSMPILWSRVSFGEAKRGEKKMRISASEFLEKCLTLSGSVPFSIEFGGSLGGFPIYHFSESTLMELAKSADRWEHVTEAKQSLRDHPDGIDLKYIMKYIPEQTIFSCLKTLGPLKSMGVTHTLPPTPELTHISIIGNIIALTSAPLLTFVDIETYHKDLPQNVITGFSWSQVTTYRSNSDFYGDSFQNFLTIMPNLNSLTLKLDMTIELKSFMKLPTLEILTLNIPNMARRLSKDPLEFLITPSLKELKLEGDAHKIFELIPTFLSRSACNLETLSLPAKALFHRNWNMAELRHVKNLYVWNIHRPYSRQFLKILEWLTWINSSRVLPGLKLVSFRLTHYWDQISSKDTFPLKNFMMMVLSRLPRPGATHSDDTNYIKFVTLTLDDGTLKKTVAEKLADFCCSDVIRAANVDVTVVIENTS